MAFNRSAAFKELFRGMQRHLTGEDPMKRLAESQKNLRDRIAAKEKHDFEVRKLQLQEDELEEKVQARINAPTPEEEADIWVKKYKALEAAKTEGRKKVVVTKGEQARETAGVTGETKVKIAGMNNETKQYVAGLVKEVGMAKVGATEGRTKVIQKYQADSLKIKSATAKAQAKLSKTRNEIDMGRLALNKQLAPITLEIKRSEQAIKLIESQIRQKQFDWEKADRPTKLRIEQEVHQSKMALEEAQAANANAKAAKTDIDGQVAEFDLNLKAIGQDEATLNRQSREGIAALGAELKREGYDVQIFKQERDLSHKAWQTSENLGAKERMEVYREHGLMSRFNRGLTHEVSERQAKQFYQDSTYFKELVDTFPEKQAELEKTRKQIEKLDAEIEVLEGTPDSKLAEVNRKKASDARADLTALLRAREGFLRQINTLQGPAPTLSAMNSAVKSAKDLKQRSLESLTKMRTQYKKYSELKANEADVPLLGSTGKEKLKTYLQKNPTFHARLQGFLQDEKDVKTAEQAAQEYAESGPQNRLSDENKARLDVMNEMILSGLGAQSKGAIKRGIDAAKKADPEAFEVLATQHQDPRVRDRRDAQIAQIINDEYKKTPRRPAKAAALIATFLAAGKITVDELEEDFDKISPDMKPFIRRVIDAHKGQ